MEFSDTTGPRGMALDRATGYLYVCDPGNHRIAVFKTLGLKGRQRGLHSWRAETFTPPARPGRKPGLLR